MCTYNIVMFSSISFGNSAIFLHVKVDPSVSQGDGLFEFAVCSWTENTRIYNNVDTVKKFDPHMIFKIQVLRDDVCSNSSQIINALSTFRKL